MNDFFKLIQRLIFYWEITNDIFPKEVQKSFSKLCKRNQEVKST